MRASDHLDFKVYECSPCGPSGMHLGIRMIHVRMVCLASQMCKPQTD